MLRYSNQKTAENRGMNWQDCEAATPVRNGNRARAECVCTPFFSIRTIRSEFPSQSLLPARFAPTMGKNVEADQSRVALAIYSGPERRGRSLRASDRDASVASEHVVHAKALGRDAQR